MFTESIEPLQVEKATKTTEGRRLLNVELEETVELREKWEVGRRSLHKGSSAPQAQAAKEDAIKQDLAQANSVFYCELCNKQYTKVPWKTLRVTILKYTPRSKSMTTTCQATIITIENDCVI